VSMIGALTFAGGAVAIAPVAGAVLCLLAALAAGARSYPVPAISFPAPALLALLASGRVARASLPPSGC